jgi:hypothetical protein
MVKEPLDRKLGLSVAKPSAVPVMVYVDPSSDTAAFRRGPR